MYSLCGKIFANQVKRFKIKEQNQKKPLQSLDFSNKIGELKQIKFIFQGDPQINFANDRLKEIVIVKTNQWNYLSRKRNQISSIY